MKAAVEAVRKHEPARVVVAVPVGASSTCRELESLADEVVCARTPEPILRGWTVVQTISVRPRTSKSASYWISVPRRRPVESGRRGRLEQGVVLQSKCVISAMRTVRG